MGFNGKKLGDFRGKKIKHTSVINQTTPWNLPSLNAAIEDGPCNQEEENCRENEKSIQIETVGISRDRG